ncbi:DNA polymerase III subunit alpha [Mycoplasma leonicaptivi]|uniref:DNA polymerase III subunit alpha n=1 Tax=Mycoplasma leonicaptivi TaxID=36742 RepID=UPI000484A932|nr:DNA polymerase III subunit alpha [Mycoplasma leonicaptivi]
MKQFIYLHTNTEYSFLQSAIRIDDLLNKAKENNQKYITITDFENFHSLQFVWNYQRKYDFKLILGVEFQLKENFRVICLAKNNKGFDFLKNLVFKKSYNQEISFYDLENENIFVIDHFELGWFANKTKIENIDTLISNFYLNNKKSLYHQTVYAPTKKVLNYEDNEILLVLDFISCGIKQETLKNDYYAYYDENEFLDVDPEILLNNEKIVSQINISKPNSEIKLAKFADNSDEIFKNLIQGNKYKKLIKNYSTEIVNQRIKNEYNTIKKLGFIDYFLIIQDVLNYARSINIEVGPGRGSAAGSLISYLLNITSVNPLEFNLLFERFLNEDRVSLPDIDNDIQDNRRDELFTYIKDKYGENNIAFISTFQTLASKSSIRDVAKFLDLSKTDLNYVLKSLKGKYDNLNEEYQKNKIYKTVADKFNILHKLASKIEGLPRQIGIHPAGLIISNQSIIDVVPTQRSSNGFQQVQMTMNNIEQYGLIKIDFLGLKNLSIISEIEKYIPIQNRFDFIINDSVSMFKDQVTFNLLNSQNTKGIFQLESDGMNQVIEKVKIDSFDDIYAIISLFRPGPLQYISKYAENKKNQQFIKKIHPIYDEIVKPTFGIIVYQEQIMQIVQGIANLTFAQADLFRRAISKKDELTLHKYKEMFFKGGTSNGIEQEILQNIFNNIELFANYGFNKSHAVAYSLLSYKMAFYKSRYPEIFYKVLLSENSSDQNAIKKYVIDAFSQGIEVELPNILISSKICEIYSKKIYLPLNSIKGIGESAIEKILSEKERAGQFNNFITTCLRLKIAGVGDAVLKTLIQADTMRDFGNITTLLNSLTYINDYFKLFERVSKNSDDKYLELQNFINTQNLYDIELISFEDDIEEVNKIKSDLFGFEIKTLKVEKPKQITHFDSQCLANLNEKAKVLIVELLDIKKGKKPGQLNLDIQDHSKRITAYSWSDSLERLLDNKTRRKIRVQIYLSKAGYYNILGYEEMQEDAI